MAGRYFEDFRVGEVLTLGSRTVSEAEIIDFARQFDPQPFHTDPARARASVFGGLIASGWHTASLYMRLLCDGFIDHVAASLGSPGVDKVEWLKPVRPGDTLTAWVECAAKVPSKSRPDMGVVHEHWRATNQKGELVVTAKGINMVRRRPA